jgi:hypothetical protein
LSYSKKKKRQLQEEKEARLNKTPEKKTRSVIKQSKAFVRKISYSYGIRLIDELYVKASNCMRRVPALQAAWQDAFTASTLPPSILL